MRSRVDRISIKDIALQCIIGIFEHERHGKQDVVISVTLYADLREAGRTDDFNKTVDYKAVKQKIVSVVEGSGYFLVEALAEAVAAACLEFDRIDRVDVIVEKPRALRFARTVAVEISRGKFD
jgi:dihydroneopterin aldolase/D-erythro-7,8-dihydroneopterin triphosphate epimerase